MRQIKVVLIDGDTGLSVMARGLRKFPIDITATAAVTDNGGSTGEIRDEMDIPIPGDIRNMIVALSNSESVLSQLFQYCSEESQISGHSLGNLLIAGMTNITNDFGHAVRALGKVLNIKGRVIPSTNTGVQLNAVMEDGEIVFGGTNIPKKYRKVDRVLLEPNDVQPVEEAIDALREAGLIVLESGSLYTDVVSNLCVDGISDTLIHSGAPKLYVSSVMTQPGEIGGYSVKDHTSTVHRQTGQPFIDYVVHSAQTFNAQVLKKYEEKHSKLIEVNKAELGKESINVETSSGLVEISENHLVERNTRVLSTMIYDITLGLASTIPFVPSDKRK